jgi:ABC-type glycerol-3-phosphate transport system permease component
MKRVTLFDTVNTALLILIAFVTLYPFWNTIAVSLNDALDSSRGVLLFSPENSPHIIIRCFSLLTQFRAPS